LGRFHNNSPLVVESLGITALPPTVVYSHGETSVVSLIADANGPDWAAGATIGKFVLTGHGLMFTNSPIDQRLFELQMQKLIEADGMLNPEEMRFLESNLVGVPEPSSLPLVMVGLGLAGCWIRRNRK
jgi:PEP-CTERM motif